MASNSIKDSVYKMTSNPLGFCIIINIVNIDGHEELTRNDSIENVISIRETFEQLKFKVIIFQDLNDTEIFSKLNQLLNREECKSHDCFVLYIHSHGKENGFITTNNEIIEYHKIYELLLNSKCQKFIRKPKLLFFDCCRGERYSVDITQVDGYYSNTHLYSDLYVCYSTLKSLVSIRGWFAQSLSECLMKFANEMNFIDIITEVNKSIQKKYHDLTGHRQSIEFRILGQNNKKLYFNYDSYMQHFKHLKEKKKRKQEDSSSNQIDGEKRLKRDSNIVRLVRAEEDAKRLIFNSKGNLNFKDLLKDFKGKNFVEVIIENEDIESIEHNDFGQITFDRVYIKNCQKLKKIHCNAFEMQRNKIKRFYAWRDDIDLLPNLISQTNSDYALIKLINSLINCEEIRMKSFYKELQPIKLNNLKELILNGKYSSYKIESICSRAFYECDKIKYINLGRNIISKISKDAFHFKNQNNEILNIILHANKLNESTFGKNSLTNLKRPTKLSLIGNEIKYLNKDVYKPFFDANEFNEIQIENRYFDDKKKENQWNRCNEKYHKKILFDLVIKNDDLQLIGDFVYNDKSYKRVVIEDCAKLQRIHRNAFGIQINKIVHFFAWNKLPELISEQNTEYDLIRLINSLINCEDIRIKPFHHELKPIKLNRLKWLTLNGSNSSNKITVICDNAFYECVQIIMINLSNNSINYINENAFCLSTENNRPLEINLKNNQLDQSSFAKNSLINFKRPTKLILLKNQIKFFKEEVFKPFLNANKLNIIEINEQNFNSNDESNEWINHINFQGIHIK